jgi:hypothetical protein
MPTTPPPLVFNHAPGFEIDIKYKEAIRQLYALDSAAQSYDDIDPVHSSAKGFIEYFARINILRISAASKLSEAKFQQDMGSWAPMGNSRDTPTRFLRRCSNRQWGFQYTNPSDTQIQRHILKCKISSSNTVSTTTTTFTCRKPDCGQQFGTLNGRNSHKRDHDFERR